MKQVLFSVIDCEKMASKKGAARWAFLFLPLFLLVFSLVSIGTPGNLLVKSPTKVTKVLKPQGTQSDTVPSPLFVDPHYRGSCDPEVVWNKFDQHWYIYYTARRPVVQNTWLRTPIGVIRSQDLAHWQFLGYCHFDGKGGNRDAEATFWAPAITVHKDSLHMFVTYKPDTLPIKGAWGGPGQIVHYQTALTDPVKGWERVGVIHDLSLNTIDATVFRIGEKYKVWFKGKKKGARKNELYQLETSDFQHWEAKGFTKSDVFNPAITGSGFEEAPYVFAWKDRYWLITDPHHGLFVYSGSNGNEWEFQGTILKEKGSRSLDGSRARHCSVAIKDDRAFIFYHVEPWRRYDLEERQEGRVPIFEQPLENRRSVLQMAEFKLEAGKITCDRNAVIKLPEEP